MQHKHMLVVGNDRRNMREAAERSASYSGVLPL